MGNFIKTAVKILALLIAWSFWAVFGTVFWIGLVARALAVFTVVFLYAMFTTQETPHVSRQMDDLSDLWFRGFRNAYASLFGGAMSTHPIEDRNDRLLLEVVWGLAFWLLILLTFSGQLLPAFGHYGTHVGTFIGGLVAGISNAIGSLGFGWLTAIALGIALVAFIVGCMVGSEAATEEAKRIARRSKKEAA